MQHFSQIVRRVCTLVLFIDLALLADESNLLSCVTVSLLSSSDHFGMSIVFKRILATPENDTQYVLPDVFGCILMLISIKHQTLYNRLIGTAYFLMILTAHQNSGLGNSLT